LRRGLRRAAGETLSHKVGTGRGQRSRRTGFGNGTTPDPSDVPNAGNSY
jgi:hypothetical protein